AAAGPGRVRVQYRRGRAGESSGDLRVGGIEIGGSRRTGKAERAVVQAERFGALDAVDRDGRVKMDDGSVGDIGNADVIAGRGHATEVPVGRLGPRGAVAVAGPGNGGRNIADFEML